MKETSEPVPSNPSSDFMSTFLTRHKPPTEATNHFYRSWPSIHLRDPSYKVIPTFSRHLKSTGEDFFFSRTVNTPETIPHFVTLQHTDFSTPETSSYIAPPPSNRTKTVVPEKPECLHLLSIQSPGVDGHPRTLHGGVTCAILDETMGLLVMLHDNNLYNIATKSSDQGSLRPRDTLYTAQLTVQYKAPIPTPGDYVVRTWLVARNGRKWFSKGQIVDSNGQVCAEGDGLWVTAKQKEVKL